MPFKKILKTFGIEAAGAKEFPERKKLKTITEDEWEERQKKKKKGLQPHGRWQMTDEEWQELEKASR